MRVGLDARYLLTPRRRGTGRNLWDAYRLIPSLRPDWQFVFFHQRPLTAELTEAPDAPWRHPNVELRRVDLPGDRVGAWLNLWLPLAARRAGVDLLHFPANVGPAWCPVPLVLTVHDLIPLRLPGEVSARQARAFRRGLLRGLRRAAHIITVSDFTRAELHHHFGVPLQRMTTIPWAPDGALNAGRRSVDDRDRIRRKFHLSCRWLLNISGRTARKNPLGVLRGFARVPENLRRELDLVLIGCEPAEYRRLLLAEAQRLGLTGHCRILGFLPHEDLAALLRNADGLLLPSRYEGFGLSILDAFACGVPVLTSLVSSLPEVAGQAAMYCDPEDIDSISRGIVELLDPAVAAELVERGRARLTHFSWQRTAEAMCQVYQAALGQVDSRPVHDGPVQCLASGPGRCRLVSEEVAGL